MDSRMPERYFGDLTDITDACWGSSSLQGICPPPLTNLSQQQQEQRQQWQQVSGNSSKTKKTK